MAAAYSPYKGHDQFLHAATLLLPCHPDAHFLLCGKDIDVNSRSLTEAITRLGLGRRVHLLGIRNDMADIYSALDIHTLNSKSESFGLATTEAMACETLCVATDVGISQTLLKRAGVVIPAVSQPGELAAAWRSLLALSPEEKARYRTKGRERIQKHYSVVKTAQQYDELYSHVA
jgi:glycosyltransferase involved in cell wall biosynthesis